MYLSTETRPDGIHCFFAGCEGKQAKHNDDRFCVIAPVVNSATGKVQYRLTSMLGHMSCINVWNNLAAVEYAALAFGLEYVARIEEIMSLGVEID